MESDFQVPVSNNEEGQRTEDNFPIPQTKSHLGVFNFGHKICVVRGGLVVGIPSCPSGSHVHPLSSLGFVLLFLLDYFRPLKKFEAK